MHTLQKQGIEPQRILKTVNANRRRQRIEPGSSSAAYRFLSGESYTRLGDDARGRPSKIGRKELAVYDAARGEVTFSQGGSAAGNQTGLPSGPPRRLHTCGSGP